MPTDNEYFRLICSRLSIAPSLTVPSSNEYLRLIAQALQGGAAVPTVSTQPPSSPVVGQRWLSVFERLVYFWNGSSWLTEQIFTATTSLTSVAATGAAGHFVIRPGTNLFLLRFSVAAYANGNNDFNNCWFFTLERSTPSADTQDRLISTAGHPAGSRFCIVDPLNFHRDAVSLDILSYRIAHYAQGSAASVATLSQCVVETHYRLARP